MSVLISLWCVYYFLYDVYTTFMWFVNCNLYNVYITTIIYMMCIVLHIWCVYYYLYHVCTNISMMCILLSLWCVYLMCVLKSLWCVYCYLYNVYTIYDVYTTISMLYPLVLPRSTLTAVMKLYLKECHSLCIKTCENMSKNPLKNKLIRWKSSDPLKILWSVENPSRTTPVFGAFTKPNGPNCCGGSDGKNIETFIPRTDQTRPWCISVP